MKKIIIITALYVLSLIAIFPQQVLATESVQNEISVDVPQLTDEQKEEGKNFFVSLIDIIGRYLKTFFLGLYDCAMELLDTILSFFNKHV